MSQLPELDPLIHAPARLRIMSTLATLGDADDITFSRLQELLDLTAGNLITHLRKLEEAGYIATSKTRDGGASATRVSLERAGRRAFEDYTGVLRAWLDATATEFSPRGDRAR